MTSVQDNNVLEQIEQLPEILPVPTSALQLLEACQDENVGAAELCKIVSCDASMSVRLLQVSNSSRYGCGGQIKTVEHASVVLGLRGLRDLAVSIVAAGLFNDGSERDENIEMLWAHSLGCATIARLLAMDVDGVCPNEAFMSGIVHDVGKLVLIQVLGDQYDLIPGSLRGESSVEVEESRYGICHAELAGQCADEWGLPFEICETLRDHHCEFDSSSHSELTAVVAAANTLSKIWNVGSDLEVPMGPSDVLEKYDLRIDDATLADMSEKAPSEYAEMQKAFEG